jgi:hypothetical protein
MRKSKSNNNLLLVGIIILIVVGYAIYRTNNSIESFSNIEQSENDLKSQCKSCKVNVDMSSLS